MPTFSGSAIEFNSFVRAFGHLIEEKQQATSHDCIVYLIQYTSGDVQELMRSCLSMTPDEGYKEARRLLKARDILFAVYRRTSFIDALRRFMARRGKPEEIRSDNGTNFVGGEKELREAINDWNQKKIDEFTVQRQVKRLFNPPQGRTMVVSGNAA